MTSSSIRYSARIRMFAVTCDGYDLAPTESFVEAEDQISRFRATVDLRVKGARYLDACLTPEYIAEQTAAEFRGDLPEPDNTAWYDESEDARAAAAMERAADAALAQTVPVCHDCGQAAPLIPHHEYDLDGVLVEVVLVCVPCHRLRVQARTAAQVAQWPQRRGRRLWWKNAQRGRVA